MHTPNVLIVGATRGLGLSLTNLLTSSTTASGSKKYNVYATTRSKSPPSQSDSPFTNPSSVNILTEVDLLHDPATSAANIVRQLASSSSFQSGIPVIDMLFITAGVFTTDTLQKPDWQKQVEMYTISSIAPVCIVSALHNANLLKTRHHRDRDGGSIKFGEDVGKIFLIGSESGSVTLRHAKEGGGNYGHHGSKSAVNMVGKLMSLDLEKEKVAVGVVHPGFMRTDMTKGVGFDEFWEEGHAVTPDEAAKSLLEFAEGFGMEKTGQYWAPRGAIDIGTAEAALGIHPKELPIPFQIPW